MARSANASPTRTSSPRTRSWRPRCAPSRPTASRGSTGSGTGPATAPTTSPSGPRWTAASTWARCACRPRRVCRCAWTWSRAPGGWSGPP
ncbi:hypothetical protein [Ornithinimicrobium kibberense]|uniref:hypothetical protein n=1 Tax=Ornithinimicrobium kibberense TaxID=282060 RepID=UPI00361428F2